MLICSFVDWFLKIDEIDMMAVSLESSLATVGGFSAGTSFVVDHQVNFSLLFAAPYVVLRSDALLLDEGYL